MAEESETIDRINPDPELARVLELAELELRGNDPPLEKIACLGQWWETDHTGPLHRLIWTEYRGAWRLLWYRVHKGETTVRPIVEAPAIVQVQSAFRLGELLALMTRQDLDLPTAFERLASYMHDHVGTLSDAGDQGMCP